MSDPRHDEVPVTQLYGALRGGDPDALRRLWPMYFRRLAAMAEKKLRGLKSGASDGEDVALNALQSFHRRATRGDFQIEDRDDLWRQLVALTHQKTIDLIRRENRAKRGGGEGPPRRRDRRDRQHVRPRPPGVRAGPRARSRHPRRDRRALPRAHGEIGG